MKRLGFAAALAGAIFLGSSSGVFADQPTSTRSQGTPGEPQCFGESMSYLAQRPKGSGEQPGRGNDARYHAVTVQYLNEEVRRICD